MKLHASKIQKLSILAAVCIALFVGSAALIVYSRRHETGAPMRYHLQWMGATTYQPDKPSELLFAVADDNNVVLKNFEIVHEKILHLVVVRKDRTNFQHVHPVFDPATGKFSLKGFRFPTAGQYRIFADFTPKGAQTFPKPKLHKILLK